MRQVSLREFRTRGAKALEGIDASETVPAGRPQRRPDWRR